MTNGNEIPHINIETTDSPSPSPVPTHVRPHTTRHSSYSSVTSTRSRRPHAQQQEYVPITDAGRIGLDERWQFEEAEEEAERQEHEEHSDDSSGWGEEAEEEPAWDNLRDGSVSRRPAWRRPSPKWLYPFIVGATLGMGMGVAPKSELYINLACLAHPPQQPRSGTYDLHRYDQSVEEYIGLDRPNWQRGLDGDMTINSTIPSPHTLPPIYQPSPADEWFKKIQREIYEYEVNHRKLHVNDSTPSTSRRPKPTTYPSSPLPKPDEPSTDPNEPMPTGTPNQGPSEPDGDKSPPPSSPQRRPPYHEIDPRLCKRDAGVQAATARLSMLITLSSGVLSALTTGYWGQISDRVGRTKILAITGAGLCISEICFILVATFPYLAPGGYRALLIGPVLEGFLGGLSTLTATINAYISDVTPDGSRAAVFARLAGIMMLGFSSGPVIGSLLIKWSHNIMLPFYINVCIWIVYVLLYMFLLPESLSSESRQILKKNADLARANAQRQDELDREWEATPRKAARAATMPISRAANERDPLLHNDSSFSRISGSNVNHSRRRKKFTGNVRRTFRKLFAFLQPLTVFFPREKEDGTKDWNLAKVGTGMFLIGCLMGLLPSKAQFAMYNYGWTSTELGPFMSVSGFSRGMVLLVIVPLALRLAKPYFYPATPEPVGPSTPGDEVAVTVKQKRPIILDLWTIRVSMTLELIPYIGLALNPSQTGFVLLSILVTFGSASSPTANSLALSLLPNSSEAGRLFGGLAVLHAMGSTIISPLLYGTVFAATVGTYAPTIFIFAAANLFLAWIMFALVRLEKKDNDAERGRSRRVKTVRSSSRVLPGPSGRVATRHKASSLSDS